MDKNEFGAIELFDIMLRKLVKEFNKKCPPLQIITVLDMEIFNLKFGLLVEQQPKLKDLLKTYDYQVDDFFKKEGDE